MNKGELIEAVSAKTKMSKKDSQAVLDAICESISEALTKGDKVSLIGFGTFETRARAQISEALTKGDKVSLIGFGTFETRARAQRKGRNPQTGAEVIIPAKKAPAFKASKVLKDAVN